ncbi:MAG: acylphosphatase [Halioglobus sp.]|nr:acylphosphatase [Halioglobus sp.]
MTQSRFFRVTGQVQGVFYRASTRARAQELDLTGWVRNCSDGSVELEASGDAEALRQLEAWLWQGPERARVTAVEVAAGTGEPVSGFEVRRD